MNIDKVLNKAKFRFRETWSILTSIVSSRKHHNVCVVVLTKSPENRKNLERCIQSYQNNCCNIEFCIVESGEYDASLSKYYYVKPAIPFHYNKYIKIALDCITLVKYSGIIISNDDVIASPNAIDRLVSSGFESCSPVDPTCKFTYKLWKPTIGYSIEYHLCGWCLFVSSKLISNIGADVLFHHNYHFYLQDVYYAELIERLGVLHAVIPSSKVVHLGHVSANVASADILEYRHLIDSVTPDIERAITAVQARKLVQKSNRL